MKPEEQIFTDPMPYDPLGLIEWVPEKTRVDRCGRKVTAPWIRKRCCRRLFRFRACRIQGGIVRATVCQRCTLEYDVVLGPRGDRAERLKELAAFCSCSEAEALRAAQVRWADAAPPAPKEPPAQPNLPYKDPE